MTDDLPATVEEFIRECPILASDLVKSISMDVVVVYLFWFFPTITDDELSNLIVRTFPVSTWSLDPSTRAQQSRRKYNAGDFRCMGGWAPDPNGNRWAKARAEEPPC